MEPGASIVAISELINQSISYLSKIQLIHGARCFCGCHIFAAVDFQFSNAVEAGDLDAVPGTQFQRLGAPVEFTW